MRHKHIVGRQLAGARNRLIGQRRAENSELVAETSPVCVGQIAGVIPPFGAIFGVRPVIGGKYKRAHRRDSRKIIIVARTRHRVHRVDRGSHLHRRRLARHRPNPARQRTKQHQHRYDQTNSSHILASLIEVQHSL